MNARPPQPRYTATWDVKNIAIERKGDNAQLSLKDLTLKTAMLLALTRPSRSADLHSLDIAYLRTYNPEGICFIPTKLAKQKKAGKVAQTFFFPRFKVRREPHIMPS